MRPHVHERIAGHVTQFDRRSIALPDGRPAMGQFMKGDGKDDPENPTDQLDLLTALDH